MPTLRILSGVNAGQTFEVHDKETLLGRDTFCDVTLPSRTVSRQHARLIKDAEQFFVEDLQSVNGTRVNNQRVKGRTPINDQDCIGIHDIVIRLELKAANQDAVQRGTPVIASTESLDLVTDDSDSSLVPFAGEESDERDSSLVKLRAVIELTKNLGSSLSLDEVLPGILDCLFEIFPQASRGYILQREHGQDVLSPIALKHRTDESDTISLLSGKIVARVMQEGTAFLSGDATTDSRLESDAESVLDEDVRSVMCAPLIGPSQKSLGVIHIETSDPRKPFVQRDLDMLISVGNLAGRAAEAAQMHEAILALDRQKRELRMARDVQLHFLPAQRPQVAGYQFFDYYHAADQMGGDYYDYVELPDGRWALVVGDVSGKGLPAAMLMARLCSEVRYCLLATDTAAAAVKMLNRQLHKQLAGDRFVTLFLCVLDPAQHSAVMVNAGHLPPFVRNGSEVDELGTDEVCLPLGVEQDAAYLQFDVGIAAGSVVLAYTDGVSEAMNNAGKTYGATRIRDVASRTNPNPVHIGQALIADVQSFVDGAPQSDDICVLGFGREAL